MNAPDLNPNAPNAVTLGEHVYGVVPQQIGRLTKQLGALFEGLQQSEDVAGMDGLELIRGRGYEALRIFIPDLMPEHEFYGYPTREAYSEGLSAYSEEYDHSPDAGQVYDAFQLVFKINRFDLIGQIKNFIGPELIRALIRTQISDFISQRSSSSRPGSDGAEPTSSGTATSPTSAHTEDPAEATPAAGNGGSQSLVPSLS